MPDKLIVARLVDPVEIGRQMQRHEQQRFSHPFNVHWIVLKSFGDKEDAWFSDNVPFVLRSEEYFNFRVEVGHQIRQLGAQEKEIFIDIVVMRLQLHLKWFDIISETHVDARTRKVTVSSETDRRTENCVC